MRAHRILAFDPGGTTGWAVFTDGPDRWTGGEIDPEKKGHHVDLFDFIQVTRPQAIVCENFLFGVPSVQGPGGEKVHMPKVELISREYIGIIKLYCEAHHIPLRMQSPSIMATTWVKDEALRRAGLYTSGARHRNDATRHLLYYLVDNGRQDLLGLVRKPR